MIAQLGRKGFKSRRVSAAQDLDQFLEFQSHLMDQLLALIEVDLRIITRQAVSRAANGESLLIQQAANLANDQHVLPLIVASIAAPLDGLQLREFLLPVTQHVRLHAAQITHFTDREIALPGNWREVAVIAWFQHMPRRAPSIFDLDGM